MGFSDPNRDRYLDYLRALAIIPVMLIHYRSNLAPGGSLGVNLFFVLSGYFIAKQLRADRAVVELVPAFWIRRMLRILPPYFVVLTACFFLVQWTDGEGVRFTQAFLMMEPPRAEGYRMGFFWTLQVEFWFYLLAPLIFIPLRNRLFCAIALCAVFAGSVMLSNAPLGSALRPWGAIGELALYASNFAVGGLCALALEKIGRMPSSVAALLIAIGLSVIIYCFTVRVGHGLMLRNYGVAVALATGLCVLAAPSTIVSKIRLPGVGYIGLISYSLYLIHLPVMTYLPISRSITVPALATYFATCIAIASVMYFVLERPSQNYARRLAKRLRLPGKARTA